MYSDEWVYGDLIHKRHDRDALMIQDENGLGSDVIPESVGQFTGLHDKNGKEIYEGDIVRFIDYTYTPLDGLKHEGYIAYNKGYFEIVVGDNLRYCLHSLQLWVYNHCEVIGNIHDNPNFLTDDND
jgi:uncharacterized phage protein (TIGR01671 family)